jgi:carbon starvation protein
MTAFIFLAAISIFCSGYIFYGRFIKNILGVDYQRKTPAVDNYDGVDYVPAKNWFILFGHHFASIAGAGPIVGPVFAYIYWGWVGVIIWLIFGSIFIGAVHDFSSLFVSLREGGISVGQIAQKYISQKASIIFLIFLWFALIIVIAVFAAICAKSFINEPKIVIPSLGLIPIAIILGFLIYRLRINVLFSTILGLLLLTFLIFLGGKFPLIAGSNPYYFWLGGLLVYAFFASIIPVDILLQPRDYISSFLLFFGIAVSVVGILIKPLGVESAQTFKFASSIGPFFPLMFITVACGAISGFHSLVCSGTTSKQLSSERDAQKIGYGAMILEGVLATIALICVAFGLKNIPQGKTPVEIFALGFSHIVFFLGDYAHFVALIILNAFILTTLDTATRITRFLTQELFRLKNKYFSTFIVVLVSGYLCLSGSWQTLWPMFGASNQLVAVLALVVVSAYLIKHKRNYKVTLIPAVIMFLITIPSLFIKAAEFFRKNNYLLFTISVILILLGLFIVVEFRKKVYRYV